MRRLARIGHLFVRRRRRTLCTAVAAAFVGGSQAAEVDNLGVIERDLAIVENVLEAALANAVDERYRLGDVEAAYLANQGVLVSLDIARNVDSRYIGWGTDGWRWNWNDVRRGIAVAPAEPRLDHLLDTLQISIAPFAPEDLAELRALRQEQRDLRNEQRQLRRRLRGLRSQAARAEGDHRIELEAEIAAEERELNALQEDYSALEADIDAEYERLRTQRNRPGTDTTEEEAVDGDFDNRIVQAVCDYGTTLNALPDDAHLTVVARFDDHSKRRFYVFTMQDVTACQRKTLDIAALRERALIYEH